MGVDFYICHACKGTFPDCGEYVCCEGCGIHWCSDGCAYDEGYAHATVIEDDIEVDYSSCYFCRRERVEDEELLEWLLVRVGMTRKQAEKELLSTGGIL